MTKRNIMKIEGKIIHEDHIVTTSDIIVCKTCSMVRKSTMMKNVGVFALHAFFSNNGSINIHYISPISIIITTINIIFIVKNKNNLIIILIYIDNTRCTIILVGYYYTMMMMIMMMRGVFK